MDEKTRQMKIEKAKKHLARIEELVAQNPSPIFLMSKEEAIETLRKTREKLWEDKLASRS